MSKKMCWKRKKLAKLCSMVEQGFAVAQSRDKRASAILDSLNVGGSKPCLGRGVDAHVVPAWRHGVIGCGHGVDYFNLGALVEHYHFLGLLGLARHGVEQGALGGDDCFGVVVDAVGGIDGYNEEVDECNQQDYAAEEAQFAQADFGGEDVQRSRGAR